MFPRSFKYFAPAKLDEAVAILKKYGENAKILAGGQSLIPLMKLRLASPEYIVDINRIGELSYIRQSGNNLLIGSMTRHHDIEKSEIIKEKCYIMAETASWIGDPQVRNLGTIGGSLAHCDPAGDWGSTIIALRAKLKATGPDGERIIESDEFFVDTFQSALKPSEVLTEIQVPLTQSASGGSYQKLERKAGDFATVGVAVQISLDEKGKCNYAGIGLTAVGPTNLRAKKAEERLVGKEITEDVIDEAAEEATDGIDPPSDIRGSSEYRVAMVKVFTRRAIRQALLRAKGGA